MVSDQSFETALPAGVEVLLFSSSGGDVLTTGAAAVMSNSTFVLPPNSYSKILVKVWGKQSDMFDATETYNEKNVRVTKDGVPQGSLSDCQLLQATTTEVNDNSGDMLFAGWLDLGPMVAGATLALTGEHDGSDNQQISYRGMLVYGVV